MRKLEGHRGRFHIRTGAGATVPATPGVALMQKHSPHFATDLPQAHAPLWLAASDGRRLERPLASQVADVAAPETPMEVEFYGITDAEQRAALAAFPGGQRFVLIRRA